VDVSDPFEINSLPYRAVCPASRRPEQGAFLMESKAAAYRHPALRAISRKREKDLLPPE